MKILLDTQIALWAWADPAQIPPNLRAALEDPAHEVYFSQVSTWEIQIKYTLGKMPLPVRPEQFLSRAIHDSGFEYLPIQDSAIHFLDRLPSHHRDPFDRLLIAHSITGALHIATIDAKIHQYPALIVP